MKIFALILVLTSVALAEPPVGDGYAAARSSHDHYDDHHHHASEHQRTLPQVYGAPSDTSGFSRNTVSTEYGLPNARSGLGSGHMQTHTRPAARVSFNRRYNLLSARSSGYPTGRSPSQEYGVPNARSGISQEYESLSGRTVSQEYGVPSVVSARTLSTEYGMPDDRSAPSEDYGVPVVSARSNQKSLTSRRDQHLQNNGPFARFQAGHTAFAASAGDSASHLHRLSNTYGVPNARSLSQEYGIPSSRANLKNVNNLSRASSSPTYLPASRGAMPSEQYGAPLQEAQLNRGQGYNYERARALEELNNQEPANYDFGYQIEDPESGSDFGHSETREENRAQGSYFVVLPDGTKQTVEYEADERGFRPRISVEAPPAGYDENAASLTRNNKGPY